MIELPSGRLICIEDILCISNIYLHENRNMHGFDLIFKHGTQLNLLYSEELHAQNDRNYLKDKLKIEYDE